MKNRRTTGALAALLLCTALAGPSGSAGAEDHVGERPTVLLRRAGSLVPERVVTIPLVVDRTLRHLDVKVRAAGASVRFRGPSGATVEEGTGVRRGKQGSGEFLRVAQPEPGTWQLEIQGDGDYRVDARGRSSVHFEAFEFVRALEPGPAGMNDWAMIHGWTHRTVPGAPVRGRGEPQPEAAS